MGVGEVGSETGIFPLLYVLKMSLRRGGGAKKAKTPLRNIKITKRYLYFIHSTFEIVSLRVKGGLIS